MAKKLVRALPPGWSGLDKVWRLFLVFALAGGWTNLLKKNLVQY